jgi:hypothetical protein
VADGRRAAQHRGQHRGDARRACVSAARSSLPPVISRRAVYHRDQCECLVRAERTLVPVNARGLQAWGLQARAFRGRSRGASARSCVALSPRLTNHARGVVASPLGDGGDGGVVALAGLRSRVAAARHAPGWRHTGAAGAPHSMPHRDADDRRLGQYILSRSTSRSDRKKGQTMRDVARRQKTTPGSRRNAAVSSPGDLRRDARDHLKPAPCCLPPATAAAIRRAAARGGSGDSNRDRLERPFRTRTHRLLTARREPWQRRWVAATTRWSAR